MWAQQRRLVSLVSRARRVCVLTGAGVSTAAGLPDFRGPQGLWARQGRITLDTFIASAEARERYWKEEEAFFRLVAHARPAAVHRALVRLHADGRLASVVTQNVDGLHQRAGSQRVIELHGNIMRSKCSLEAVILEPGEDDADVPPSCPRCGASLRPDVVWFGEMLPQETLEEAFEAAQGCDLFLSIGTSSLVQPAASLPFEALHVGVAVVEVNPDETPLTSHVEYALRGRAGEVLPALVGAVYG
jgi:NAD-dependent deacetylase